MAAAVGKISSPNSHSVTPDEDGEGRSLWENHAFERSGIATDVSMSAMSLNVIDVNPETIAYDNAFDNELDMSLPSSHLRKMNGLLPVPTTTLRYRQRNDDDNQNNEIDGPSEEIIDVRGLDEEQIGQMRSTTLDMKTKKSVRRHTVPAVQLSCWKRFKFSLQLRWAKMKDNAKDFLKTIDLWHGHMRKIEGSFGTGILSYFLFLRWLFLLNLLIGLLTVLFLFIPQISFEKSTDTIRVDFNGTDLLTGEGWFLETELYYGQYTNLSIPVPDSTPYHMPQAYFFVGAGYLLVCMIILVWSMANSYKENYIIAGSRSATFTAKVFCSWDYGVMKSEKIRLQSIYNDFVESLADDKKQTKKTFAQHLPWLAIRFTTNVVIFALMAGAIYIVLLVSDKSMKADVSAIESLLPAIAISGFNMVLPFAFRIVASLEQYESGKTELQVTLWRTILLKLASLTVYVVAVLRDLTCVTDRKDSCRKTDCWESLFGSLFYKLIVIDFIYLLLTTLVEPVRRILANYIPWWFATFGLPGFDISRNVLDLIYSQGVCWIGTFYCPLLPLVNIIKLFILFYIKRFSVIRNCQASTRPFQAAKMNLVFLVLLGLMQLLSIVVVGYLIINDGILKPSQTCGPFRGRESVYDLIKSIVNNDLPEGLRETVQIISSASLITAFLFVLGLVAYYFKLRKSSAEKRITLLKQQISLAGKDKLFLKQKLRAILKKSICQNRRQ